MRHRVRNGPARHPARTVLSLRVVVIHMARTITKVLVAIVLVAVLYKLASGRAGEPVDVDIDTVE